MEFTNLTIADLRPHVLAHAKPALEAMGLPTEVALAPSPNPEMGDLGFPCFPFAKIARKAPNAIAEELAAAMEPDGLIEAIVAVGPYVNFRFNPAAITEIVLQEALGGTFGSGGLPADQRHHWMVEYSAPNTNKPQHLGHVRNNVIGYATSLILEYAGHTVSRVNLINDRGIHICKSMLAYATHGEGATPESTGIKGDHFVGNWYVRFESELAAEYAEWLETDAAESAFAKWLDSRAGKQATAAHEKGKGGEPRALFTKGHRPAWFNSDSKLGAEARDMLLRWEEGDEDTVALWRMMNQWVFDGFDATYARLGVSFDRVYYESQTYLLGKEIVEEGLQSGVLERLEDGAVVFDLERIGKTGQKVLLRSDGTSVYMTQDLGTAVQRFEDVGIDRLAYVVADEQTYHFEVLFGVLGALREELQGACHHLSYGMVHLPEGRMKSREGTIVDCDDLMDGMRDLALEEILAREATNAESRPDHVPLEAAEAQRRAEVIGKAALKYYLLNFTPQATITFDPKRSIDFLGQTGPYCLYAYARVQSLLGKADVAISPDEWSAALAGRLESPLEAAVIRELQAFPGVVTFAAEHHDTSKIADQTYRIAKTFSTLYNDRNHQIVGNPDKELGKARLLLATAVAQTIAAGLALLGIETLESM